MSSDMSNISKNDNKFRRRTSNHNLRLDVNVAAAAASGIRRPYTCPCNTAKSTYTDIYDNTPQDPQVVEEGKQLFKNFVQEEMRREGLLVQASSFSLLQRTPLEHDNRTWVKAGRELRELADEFNRTIERRKVRLKANQVGIEEIKYNQFYALLTELFTGEGITRERILVLFFFCSDLAIRTFRQQTVNIFQKCLEWSQQYITERVCLWVQQQGGWAAVLHRSVRCFKQVVFIVGIVAVGVLVLRSLRMSQ